MSYPVFTVPAGDVLPIPFASYASATGASTTLTGLAVTDIEIYKNGSTTERASDAGYTLLDTDGIDFDGITGIHGFSIDTGDNTDAGFYTVGAWFTVVVSAVTVDGQTVSFIAAQFRIVPAESSAGVPKVDVSHAAGTAWGSGAITAASIATGAIDADALAADAVAEIVDGVLDEPIAGHLSPGSVGEAIDNAGAGGTPPSAADIADAVWDEDLTGHTTPDSAGLLLGTAGATTDAQIADKILGRNIAGGSDGGRTVTDAFRLLRNKSSIAAGTLTVTEEDDSTPAWTAAVTTAAGDPITGLDPA
jgi:hypothetical protein